MSINCLECNGQLRIELEGVFDTRFGIETLYNITKCEQCNLEQTSPVPKQKEMNELYERYYNFSGIANSRYLMLRKKFVNSFLYQLWLMIDGDISFHRNKGEGNLLDVGCNEGRGLEFYRKNGLVAEGLELNSKAAAEARGKGFKVHGSTLEEFVADKKYDIVVLSNVLEHSLSPGNMLHHISKLLNSQGYIWISCPNSKSWLRNVFGRYWINWHVPFHVVHFSPKTLKEMLKKSGFEIVSLRQETPALWVAHTILARVFAKRGIATMQLRSAHIVASLLLLIRCIFFPILWLANFAGKGDCLVVVARKQ